MMNKSVLMTACAVIFLFGGSIAAPVATAGELPFVENGVLYSSPAESSVVQDATTLGKGKILAHNPTAGKLLYVTPQNTQGTDVLTGGNLMLVDMATLGEQLVATNVIAASLSPDGTAMVLWNKDHEIHLTDSVGTVSGRIGMYGAAPVFSHNGRFIAYLKLADVTLDSAPQSLFEHAQGIAVYDVRTGRETLVTDGGLDDFAPVGFSLNMTKLYFNATRPYAGSPQNHIASLWVVDLTSGKVERLTNTDEKAVKQGIVVPTVSENALWSSDRTIVISSNGKEQGIWLFSLAPSVGTLEATHIADGESPQWLVSDESIVFRAISDGKSAWHILNIR